VYGEALGRGKSKYKGLGQGNSQAPPSISKISSPMGLTHHKT